ncbi:MFS transporter [Methylocystis heyeri]|uniref:MFS transporter n=1 Tax=Methylocystis heyeri TaxID=391905 RepID=A0A6B8KF94_9HYPH|nr:MFS transporter [Methylocystis heyeri]
MGILCRGLLASLRWARPLHTRPRRGDDVTHTPAITKLADPYRWTALALATWAQVAGCFLMQGLGALGPQMQRAMGLNAAKIGLLSSSAQLAPIIGLLVAGELLDRFSERLIVGLGAAMVSASIFAASRAESYTALLACLVVASIGYSSVQPGGGKAVASWFAPNQRGLAMGVRQAGLPLGAALGTLILPAVAQLRDWRGAFALGALVALLGGLSFAALYRAPAEGAPRLAEFPPLSERLALLRLPGMRRILLPGVTLVSLQFALSVYLPLDVRDRFALPAETGVAALFAAQAAGAVGRIVLAFWSDHSDHGRYFPLQASMAALVAGTAAYVALPAASPALLYALALWLGFFGFGWYGPWIALVSETAPPGRIGFMIGLVMAVNQIAVVLAPPLFGWLRDASGSFVFGWLLLTAASAAALAITRRG